MFGTEYPRTPAHPDSHEQPNVKVQHHSTVSAEETFYKTPGHSNAMLKVLVLLSIPHTSTSSNANANGLIYADNLSTIAFLFRTKKEKVQRLLQS